MRSLGGEMTGNETRRARRRRDAERMKGKARRVRPNSSYPERLADHLAVCSCWMCGNPRRFLGEPTIQERRALLVSIHSSDICMHRDFPH